MAATSACRDGSRTRTLYTARSAFTLVEMLVVVAIVSIFVGVIGFGFLRGSGNATIGLQAAQSTVVALLMQARSQAVLTARETAFLVNDNVNNPLRYRRYLCVAVRGAGGQWEPLDAGVFLPERVYVVPHDSLSTAEVDGGNWTDYESTALQLVEPGLAVEASPTARERWIGVGFTPRGTTTDGAGGITGDIVLATGRVIGPGATPPFIYTNRDGVRGLAINALGQTRLLNEARDFLP